MKLIDRIPMSLVVVTAFMGGMALDSCARAETFRVIVAPPTVAGRPPDASWQAYERQPPHVRFRPVARAYELGAPAPRGRCGALFEVLSGPPAQRGCYGWK